MNDENSAVTLSCWLESVILIITDSNHIYMHIQRVHINVGSSVVGISYKLRITMAGYTKGIIIPNKLRLISCASNRSNHDSI